MMPTAKANAKTSARDGAEDVVLGKYEGAGNDFLVLLEPLVPPLDRREVAVLCDRRRGVGADGLLELRPGPPGADLGMVLWNADGSPAEMSGNGIRCLVHAALDAGWVRPGPVRVATAAGLRTVDLVVGGEPGTARAKVAMGAVELGAGWSRVGEVWRPVGQPGGPPAGAPRLDADTAGALLSLVGAALGDRDAWVRLAGAGNPHVVVILDPGADCDPATLVRELGPAVERLVPGGANLEVVLPETAGRARLAVFERGVGPTEACGTGTVAASAVLVDLGLARLPVAVANPGGVLEVTMGEAGLLLAGPSRRVARVRVAREWIATGVPR
jgi:diaminopimelate epimerase